MYHVPDRPHDCGETKTRGPGRFAHGRDARKVYQKDEPRPQKKTPFLKHRFFQHSNAPLRLGDHLLQLVRVLHGSRPRRAVPPGLPVPQRQPLLYGQDLVEERLAHLVPLRDLSSQGLLLHRLQQRRRLMIRQRRSRGDLHPGHGRRRRRRGKYRRELVPRQRVRCRGTQRPVHHGTLGAQIRARHRGPHLLAAKNVVRGRATSARFALCLRLPRVFPRGFHGGECAALAAPHVPLRLA
mmetsp:Transcript_6022/g.23175  ORF Transcript_6022/g.23175 Transcript_6022/m.23175 type:complete len:239 (+) Transcript_6022:2266-2982(+)